MCRHTLYGTLCSIVVTATIAQVSLLNPAHSEVITDGSVGSRLNIQGPDFVIPQSLGSTVGSNLFHSFQSFNINNSQSTTFTGSNNISNVISRVTGGQSSTIDGVLHSEVGRANFFFINPAGILFGPNASINVPAAFHASTAANLQFSDGAVFSAANPAASTLSMASPSAFGFVANRSADIRIEQSQLLLTPETETSLSGGNIVIDSGTLINSGGKIMITAVGKIDDLVSSDEIANKKFQGNIQIKNSNVIVSGTGTGKITLAGGETGITKSNLVATYRGRKPAEKQAGIEINVQSLNLENSEINSGAGNIGSAGDIAVSVVDHFNLNGSVIDSATSAEGNAGSITIHSGSLDIDGQGNASQVFSFAGNDSMGNAGNIDISVDKTMNLINGGGIVNSSLSTGNVGSVKIHSANLTIDGKKNNQNFTGITTSASSGSSSESGNIDITVADSMNLVNGAQINSSTFVKEGRNAGSITVAATNLNISNQAQILSGSGKGSGGRAGDIMLTISDLFSMSNSGSIISNTFSAGDAGLITVKAADFVISNGSSISSDTSSDGDAGMIMLTATEMTIDGQGRDTGIFSRANENSTGNAGNISIQVDNTLNLLNGGNISNDTFATGGAGSIIVKSGAINLIGQGVSVFTGLSNATFSSARAGNVDVMANNLTLTDGGVIRNNTFSTGDAGSVKVQVNNLRIDGQDTAAGFFSQTAGSGDAGDINVFASGTVSIRSGGRIANDTFSAGNAGSMTVQAPVVDINGSGNTVITGLLSRAQNASSGQAGTIKVRADRLALRNNGNINIQSKPTISASSLPNILSTEINLQADKISLENNSTITAESNGNIAASDITINAVKQLRTRDSRITTAANQADGGKINVSGGNVILRNSQITTSVAGNGNGGDITLSPRVLVLNTGFVQANTAGANATGGNININSEALISSNNHLQTGGNQQIQFAPNSGRNVIQAAAPDGVSGSISITSPQLNISGTLATLETQLIDIDRLIRDPCASPASKQSKLISISKGGLPASVEQPLPVLLDPVRLQKILGSRAEKPLTTPQRMVKHTGNIPCS